MGTDAPIPDRLRGPLSRLVRGAREIDDAVGERDTRCQAGAGAGAQRPPRHLEDEPPLDLARARDRQVLLGAGVYVTLTVLKAIETASVGGCPDVASADQLTLETSTVPKLIVR